MSEDQGPFEARPGLEAEVAAAVARLRGNQREVLASVAARTPPITGEGPPSRAPVVVRPTGEPGPKGTGTFWFTRTVQEVAQYVPAPDQATAERYGEAEWRRWTKDQYLAESGRPRVDKVINIVDIPGWAGIKGQAWAKTEWAKLTPGGYVFLHAEVRPEPTESGWGPTPPAPPLTPPADLEPRESGHEGASERELRKEKLKRERAAALEELYEDMGPLSDREREAVAAHFDEIILS